MKLQFILLISLKYVLSESLLVLFRSHVKLLVRKLLKWDEWHYRFYCILYGFYKYKLNISLLCDSHVYFYNICHMEMLDYHHQTFQNNVSLYRATSANILFINFRMVDPFLPILWHASISKLRRLFSFT